jgi:hypothetical protein
MSIMGFWMPRDFFQLILTFSLILSKEILEREVVNFTKWSQFSKEKTLRKISDG